MLLLLHLLHRRYSRVATTTPVAVIFQKTKHRENPMNCGSFIPVDAWTQLQYHFPFPNLPMKSKKQKTKKLLKNRNKCCFVSLSKEEKMHINTNNLLLLLEMNGQNRR